MGKSQRRELRSRLDSIIEHILKLAYSPALDPREGWRTTVSRERREIQLLLDDNRSLRREVSAIIEATLPGITELVAEDLLRRGEVAGPIADAIRRVRLSESEVLGRWFPEPPARC